MIERREEIAALGEVVLIAYDEQSLLEAKMLKGIDVPYRLLIDSKKRVYAEWGLGRTGLMGAMLSPGLNWRYLKLLLQGERFLGVAPDMFQLGGDFVIDAEGKVVFAHRMRNSGDRAEVTDLIAALSKAASAQ